MFKHTIAKMWVALKRAGRLVTASARSDVPLLWRRLVVVAPLINGFVDDSLRNAPLSLNEALFKFGCVTHCSLVNSFLHEAPDTVVDWVHVLVFKIHANPSPTTTADTARPSVRITKCWWGPAFASEKLRPPVGPEKLKVNWLWLQRSCSSGIIML